MGYAHTTNAASIRIHVAVAADLWCMQEKPTFVHMSHDSSDMSRRVEEGALSYQ